MIEAEIQGKPPDERRQVRRSCTRSNCGRRLLRYCDDCAIEIDNSAAERALRGFAIDRPNYLFAGADS